MARSFNQATVYGNVTRDPELRTIPSGTSVATFAVATNRQWKTPEGEQKESVEFHNVVSWGKQAEIVSQYVKKGDKILVVGRLQTRNWDDQQGIKHYRTEIVSQDVVFGGGGGRPGAAPAEEQPAPEQPAPKSEPEKEEDINIEDLPF